MNQQQGPPDPLEERVRRALHDDRWQLPGDDTMLERVYAGAARRRRRRQVGVGLAAAALVVSGAGVVGYVVGPLGQDTITTASRDTAHESEAPGRARGGSETRTTAESEAEPKARSEANPGDMRAKERLRSQVPGLAAVPEDFETASFTATAASRFWLLGSTGGGAGVAVTTDGGQTFGLVGRIDARVADDQTTDQDTVHDLRFADDRNGWAYGGALYSTHDGGRSWARVTAIPGEVDRLEAGGGYAYALVRSGDDWSLWRTAAGDDAWTRLDARLTEPSDLAITESAVVVTQRAEGVTTSVSGPLGENTFEVWTTPCVPSLSGGTLSAGGGSLWLKCPTGTAAEFYYSIDDGRSWEFADVPGSVPPNIASVVAARTADEAVVALPGEIRTAARGSGSDDPEMVDELGEPVYAGFTTPDVGYVLDRSGRLFRTTDGGDTWNLVPVD